MLITLSGSSQPVVTIVDGTFTDDATSANVPQVGVDLVTDNTAVATATIARNSFTKINNSGVSLNVKATSQLTAFVEQNTIGNLTTSAGGVALATENSTVAVTIADNTISSITQGYGVSLFAPLNAQATVQILRNTISTVGADRFSKGIQFDSSLTSAGRTALRIDGNQISGITGSGIWMRVLGALSLDATVTNNSLLNTNLANSSAEAAFRAFNGSSGTTPAANLTLNLTGSSIDSKGVNITQGASNTGAFRVEGNTGLTAQQNITNNNTISGGGTVTVGGTVGVTAVGTITPPSENRVPVAAADSATAVAGVATTMAVLPNDNAVDADAKLLSGFTPISARGGSVARNDNGTPADQSEGTLEALRTHL